MNPPTPSFRLRSLAVVRRLYWRLERLVKKAWQRVKLAIKSAMAEPLPLDAHPFPYAALVDWESFLRVVIPHLEKKASPGEMIENTRFDEVARSFLSRSDEGEGGESRLVKIIEYWADNGTARDKIATFIDKFGGFEAAIELAVAAGSEKALARLAAATPGMAEMILSKWKQAGKTWSDLGYDVLIVELSRQQDPFRDLNARPSQLPQASVGPTMKPTPGHRK